MDEELQELLEEYKQKTADLLTGVNQLKPRPEVLPAVPLEILFYINYLLNGAGGTEGGGDASNANQLTPITRLEQIRDRLSSSADDVIFAKLAEILTGISNLATQATLLALNAKIPTSPAQDRTTATSPTATRLTDGTNFYKPTTPTDTQPVSAASLPLPTGAATESMLQQVRDAISITTTTTPIATTGSGDKTILTPSSGKALRISSFYIVADSQVGITLKKTAAAISGVMNITELVAEPTEPICLAVDQIFVVNVATAVNVNGFIVWWEV